jgi:hypothetical protein
MGVRAVINTGPLIALAAADALGITGRLPLQLICPAEAAAMGNSASQGYTLYKFRVTELRILAARGDAPDLDTGVPVLPTGLLVETVADRL